MITSLAVTAPAAAHDDRGSGKNSGDPAVVTEWNAIAVTTLAGNAATMAPEDFLYLSFVQAAVYNAVVGIEGGYKPYKFHAKAKRGASSQAAAVAAAHKVLVTYSPDAQDPGLDTAYATSLAKIPDGEAKTRGVAFGELAADTMIAQRADDGRDASMPFTTPPAPGVWRPTPPAFAPFAMTWLGAVDPLLIRSGAQFGDPGPPPAMTSRRYAKDFDEVKSLGSKGSTERSMDQTAIATFYSGNPVVQFNAALRGQVPLRQMDIVDAARMFAAVNMSTADALISVWYAKFLYGFWRPMTAIQLADTDGNPATSPDTAWEPLIANPPYPDYVSGYSGAIGGFTAALQKVLGTRHLNLTFMSTAVPNVTRPYDSGKVLRQDVVDARVWLGIHFRFADTRGAEMGVQVADWALDRYFRPTGHHGHN